MVIVSNLANQSANTSLTLPASSLSPGDYYVTDLYNNKAMGTLSINEDGGFENWQLSSAEVNARSTSILLLTKEQPVNTNQPNLEIPNFELYPNPTEKVIYIDWKGEAFEKGIVTVVSAFGTIVHNEKIQGVLLPIVTEKWTPGIYFVQISHDGKIGLKRILVL